MRVGNGAGLFVITGNMMENGRFLTFSRASWKFFSRFWRLIGQHMGNVPACKICCNIRTYANCCTVRPNDFGRTGVINMSGYGSGRWNGHIKKDTVEECCTLDLARLKRDGLFNCPPGSVQATLHWTNAATGKLTSSIGLILENKCSDLVLMLTYMIKGEDVHIPVFIQTTMPHFGGIRYWGTCPDCGRRVRRLHKPPSGRRFSSRTCLDLTYVSAQEAHKMDSVERFLGRFMDLPPGTLKITCNTRIRGTGRAQTPLDA